VSKPLLGQRTAKEAMRELDENLVLPGFPRGPFNVGVKELQNIINKFTFTTACPGGGFKVNRHRSVDDKEGKVVKQAFRCNGGCGKNDKNEAVGVCTWEVTFELSTAGWVLTRWHEDSVLDERRDADGNTYHVKVRFPSQHRHVLLHHNVELRAQHGGRTGIHDQSLLDIAQEMVDAHQPCKNTHRVLLSAMAKRGMDTTAINYDWTWRKFYTASAAIAAFDVSDMVDLLKARKEAIGLNYEVHVDNQGFVDALFWENEGAMEEWSIASTENVILFDPTHGTNRHNLKLCCFVGVSQSGHNTILACVMIEKESCWFFEWSLRCFALTFRLPPALIFTDRDEELATAIQKLINSGLWPDIKHLLCVFHISVNLFTHLHPLFTGNPAGWREFHDLFWRVVKATDLSRTVKQGVEGSWEYDVTNLVDLLEKHIARSDKRNHEVEWFQALMQEGSKFAARFTWALGSCGIHSTQRAESNQSKVKVCCCSAPTP